VPRTRDPAVADRLIEAAARVLAEDGHDAVTARRMAAEVGTSTMAVYTHFGSMDDLLGRVWREGFDRFGAALESPPLTADPIADWAAQGWAYRRFALENRHLYRAMFGEQAFDQVREPADLVAAAATFASLLDRLRRAVAAGRLAIEDIDLAGQVVWASVHGHMSLELNGAFVATRGEAVRIYREGLRRLALGFGDDPDRLSRSLEAADPDRRVVSRR